MRCWKIVTIILVLLGVLLIIIFSLIGVSVNKVVENNEYGVEFNNITMEFGDIKEQGIYSIPPGTSMFRFNRTVQEIEDTVTCFSSDKITITLKIATQFLLQKDGLIDHILKEYDGNDNFKYFLSVNIKNIVIDRCGQYTAENYYVKRADIDRAMFEEVLNGINNNLLGATIELFQLKEVSFPGEFSNIITQKQVVIQNATTIGNQRASLLIAANTTLEQAKKHVLTLLINANNEAEINLKQANATNQIILNEWEKRGQSFFAIKTSLNLNETGFIDYIESELLRKATNSIVNI